MDVSKNFNPFRVEIVACLIHFPELHLWLFIFHSFGMLRSSQLTDLNFEIIFFRFIRVRIIHETVLSDAQNPADRQAR